MKVMRVLDAAQRLGMDVRKSGNTVAIYGCPNCCALTRHTKSKDRRGAVGVTPDGGGWRCFQCCASGDAIDLVAYELCDARWRDLRDDQKEVVRAKCIELTGTSTLATGSSSKNRRKTARAAESSRAGAEIESSPGASPKTYLSEGAWDEFWNLCRPVTDAPYTAAALTSKRIDPRMVADFDLARALPTGGQRGSPLPSWASFRGSNWRALGYHWITPLCDAHGVRRSFVARNILPTLPTVYGEQVPKALFVPGLSRSGLVIACPLGRQILARGALPVWPDDHDTWWPKSECLRIEICEGGKKFLQRVISRGDAAEYAPAVLGVDSGSWTDEFAARVPDGTTVYIATDQNDAGASYAAKIVQTLAQRIASGAVRVELRDEFKLKVDRHGRIEVGVAA